jgi:hypothetical protein
MRYLAALLAFTVCGSVIAAAPDEPRQHDGAWLENGLKAYQRLNAHESLAEQDASAARVVTSYVCAVVEMEKSLVMRANLLAAAFHEGRRRKQHIDARTLEGMGQALPLIVPLMQSGFPAENPSCEQTYRLVQDFLEQYPEVLDKGADVVVEKALLDAYDRTKQP